MEIAVLLEPVPGKGYRARGGEPFAVEAEGSTKEEALRKFREIIASRFESGAEIVAIKVPTVENPWSSFAGMFREDPLFDRWQAAIAARRDENQ